LRSFDTFICSARKEQSTDETKVYHTDMAETSQRDIITIGASSGGLEALLAIVTGLPKHLAASLFVVLHVRADAPSELPAILSRAGPLAAVHASDRETIEQGKIYVAPPDNHLLFKNGQMRVVRGPKENNHRPAIDPLFRSAAEIYGPRVIGIVLSGNLDDGTAGLFAIKRQGGIAIVQDPNDALFADMPRNALSATRADYCVPKSQIPVLIKRLTGEADSRKTGDVMATNDKMKKEDQITAINSEAIIDEDKPGRPSAYGCPDCGGALWEIQDGEWLRFRCRVGHAFSAEGLLRSETKAVESALWNAFRALHENAALARRLAKRARDNHHTAIAEKYEHKSQRGEEEAEIIRSLLLRPLIGENETEDTEPV